MLVNRSVVLAALVACAAPSRPVPRSVAPRPSHGLGAAFGTLVADGAYVVLRSSEMTLLADTTSGAITSTTLPYAVSVEPIPGTPLFVTHELEALVLREAPTGNTLERFVGAQEPAISNGLLLVAVPGEIIAYDVHARAVTRRIPTPNAWASDLAILDRALSATVTFDDSTIEPPSTQITYDLTTGAELLRQYASYDVGPPAFSKGRIAATVTPRGYDRPDDIRLVDRQTRKTLATSSACDYPTSFAFSEDGRYLAVGQLLRVCIFDTTGSKLRLVARTPPLRTSGPGDDLQDTTVRIANGTLYAESGDGTSATYRVPSGKPLTTPTQTEPPIVEVPDAIMERVGRHVCHLDGRLLPRAACD